MADFYGELKEVEVEESGELATNRRRTRSMRVPSVSGGSDSVIHSAKSQPIYTAGRPPWYNKQGESLKEAFVIGLCGGSASCKTTVAKKITEALGVPWVTLISMDSFYKDPGDEGRIQAEKNEYNFDHPDAFDFELLISTLRRLKRGLQAEIPNYDFATHSRTKEKKLVYGADVIIAEGILFFFNKELLNIMDLKIFVDTDSDIRLARRLRKDVLEMGQDLKGVIKQYNSFVKPSFEQFIEPYIKYADLVIPRGWENDVAMNLIVKHIHRQLEQRGVNFRKQLKEAHQQQPMPNALHVVEISAEIRHALSLLRNRETNQVEFIYNSHLLTKAVVDKALSILSSTHFKEKDKNAQRMLPQIAGVSILRAGKAMEGSLREACANKIRIGRLSIQSNLHTLEPELHQFDLPENIREDYVIVLDALVATGAASMMAIRVLLDHEVPEENIMLVSLLMAETGVHTVAYAFPKVKMVTIEVDKEVDENFHISPGIGKFSDRYFGTGQ